MYNKRQRKFIQFISLIALLNSWAIFEELVIDRQGLWKYLPGYKYGNFCLWDIGAIIIFSVLVWQVFKDKKQLLEQTKH